MKKRLNILFLGGAKRVSLAEKFIISGQELGFAVKVYSYELTKIVPFSIIGEVIVGKKWEDENILDHLYNIIEKKKINIVLANVDLATIVLSKLKLKYPNIGLITTDAQGCNIVLDKVLMHNECISKGIKTIPLSKNKYPIFVKPRKGSASIGSEKINGLDHETFFFKGKNKSEYIFQKYISGTEYTVDAYVTKKGVFVGAVPRVRTDVTSGESTTAKIVRDDEIVVKTKFILSKFELIGPLTLQFIRAKDELFFLELNPRFGGGVIASIEAGFNIPKIMIQDFMDKKIKPQKRIKKLIMTRCYREVFHAIDN